MRKLYPVFHNSERALRYKRIYERRMVELVASGETFELYRSFGEGYREVLADEIN